MCQISRARHPHLWWCAAVFATLASGCASEPSLGSNSADARGSAARLEFAPTYVGDRVELPWSLQNTGAANLHTTVQPVTTTAFTVAPAVGGPGPTLLHPGETLALTVTFAPSTAEQFAGTFAVRAEAVGGAAPLVFEVALAGNGVTPPPCDDDNPCTTDRFDAAVGSCAFVVHDGACALDDPCLEDGSCVEGRCLGRTRVCDDGDPCTLNFCATGLGCVHPPDLGRCDDANSCSNDACLSDGSCENIADDTANGQPCGLVSCNNVLLCSSGACTPFSIDASAGCDDGNRCTVPRCEGFLYCAFDPVVDGTPCPGSNGCGEAYVCGDGQCHDPGCDDGNPCTEDSCGSDGQCQHTTRADGEDCSGDDCGPLRQCDTGVCQVAPGQSLCTAGAVVDSMNGLQNLAGCNVVDGDLQIRGAPITTLDALSNLTAISGTLQIDNTALTDLDGLQNLACAGSLRLKNNSALGTMDNLVSFQRVERNIIIDGNRALMTLAGLGAITGTVAGNLVVTFNESLADASALAGITAVGGLLRIQGVLLNELTLAVERVSGRFELGYAPYLNTVRLPVLRSVGSAMTLEEFPGVLEAPALESVGGNVTLAGLPGLTSLAGFAAWRQLGGTLKIYNIAATSLAPLSTLHGGAGIHIEATSLTTLAGIGGLNARNGILLINNPQLTDISDLGHRGPTYTLQVINNPQLASLRGLEGTTEVAGDLTIQDQPLLENLDPLAQVRGTLQSLTIDSNDALIDVNGLGGVGVVNGAVTITRNPQLRDLWGLQGLRSAGALTLTAIGIRSLVPLANLRGGLTSLTVRSMENLESLAGLEGISELGDLSISAMRLSSLAGLEGVRGITGDLSIQSDDFLQGLVGLGSAGESIENVRLAHAPQLTDLAPLASLRRIGDTLALTDLPTTDFSWLAGVEELGRLWMERIPGFTSMTALSGVRGEVGELYVAHVPITSLQGLEGIERLGTLYIASCHQLTSLAGVEGVTEYLGGSVTIAYLDSLPACAAQELASRWSTTCDCHDLAAGTCE